MLVTNPVRESYDEIREKYDGYCVLVIESDRDEIDFGTGKAFAYDEDLATLTGETMDLINEGMGIFAYHTFTHMGSLSPFHVTHHV